LSGWAYVTSRKTAAELAAEASKDRWPLWIDDLWVTGVLARRINARLLTLNSLYTVHKDHLQCCLDDQRGKDGQRLLCDFLVGPSSGDAKLVIKLGRLAAECRQIGLCQRRTWEKSIARTCIRASNPFLLPDSPGVGQVFVLDG